MGPTGAKFYGPKTVSTIGTEKQPSEPLLIDTDVLIDIVPTNRPLHFSNRPFDTLVILNDYGSERRVGRAMLHPPFRFLISFAHHLIV